MVQDKVCPVFSRPSHATELVYVRAEQSSESTEEHEGPEDVDPPLLLRSVTRRLQSTREMSPPVRSAHISKKNTCLYHVDDHVSVSVCVCVWSDLLSSGLI